jgi:hypothetical protein
MEWISMKMKKVIFFMGRNSVILQLWGLVDI